MFVRRLVPVPLVFALSLAPVGARAAPPETASEDAELDAAVAGDGDAEDSDAAAESVAPVDDPFAATRESAGEAEAPEAGANPGSDAPAGDAQASEDVPNPDDNRVPATPAEHSPTERPPTIHCKNNDGCPQELACHLTQKVCMEPKYVVANAKKETRKLAIAAPIAIVMGGGFAGLGVWGILVGQDEKDEADMLMGSEADDLRAQGNLKVGLGAGAVSIGSLAAVGALIGLAVLPLYVKRRKGAEKRLPVTALGGPRSAGVALRF